MTGIDGGAFAALSSLSTLGAAVGGDSSLSPTTGVLTAALAAFASVAVATPLAFALGRLVFEGRAMVFAILVLASSTSPELLGPPAPLVGRFNHYLAFGIPIATWIVYLVIRALPADLDDARTLDGASAPRLWLPLLRPAAFAAAILVYCYAVFDLAGR